MVMTVTSRFTNLNIAKNLDNSNVLYKLNVSGKNENNYLLILTDSNLYLQKQIMNQDNTS